MSLQPTPWSEPSFPPGKECSKTTNLWSLARLIPNTNDYLCLLIDNISPTSQHAFLFVLFLFVPRNIIQWKTKNRYVWVNTPTRTTCCTPARTAKSTRPQTSIIKAHMCLHSKAIRNLGWLIHWSRRNWCNSSIVYGSYMVGITSFRSFPSIQGTRRCSLLLSTVSLALWPRK